MRIFGDGEDQGFRIPEVLRSMHLTEVVRGALAGLDCWPLAPFVYTAPQMSGWCATSYKYSCCLATWTHAAVSALERMDPGSGHRLQPFGGGDSEVTGSQNLVLKGGAHVEGGHVPCTLWEDCVQTGPRAGSPVACKGGTVCTSPLLSRPDEHGD